MLLPLVVRELCPSKALEESIYLRHEARHICALQEALHLLCDLPKFFSPGLPASVWAIIYEQELSFSS